MSLVRRRFQQFLVTIALVHLVAIAAYYGLRVRSWPEAEQRLFAWVWMGATVAAVLIGLQRIKRARRPGSIRNRP